MGTGMVVCSAHNGHRVRRFAQAGARYIATRKFRWSERPRFRIADSGESRRSEWWVVRGRFKNSWIWLVLVVGNHSHHAHSSVYHCHDFPALVFRRLMSAVVCAVGAVMFNYSYNSCHPGRDNAHRTGGSHALKRPSAIAVSGFAFMPLLLSFKRIVG